MSDSSTAAETKPTRWRELRSGRSESELVLGVDFDAGRGDASLRDLAQGLGDRRVWESIPPSAAGNLLQETEPDSYLRSWLEQIPAHPTEVKAVLGCCAGASPAVRLAAWIRQAGLGEPALIVFDPIPVDAGVIAHEFSLALDSLAPQLDAGQLQRQREIAASLAEQTNPNGSALVPAVTMIEASYRSAVHLACERLKVPPAFEAQLGDRFATYLTYLLACSRSTAALEANPAAAKGLTAVLSAHHEASSWPGLDENARIVRFAAPAPRLLADAEVAAFVSGLFEGRVS